MTEAADAKKQPTLSDIVPPPSRETLFRTERQIKTFGGSPEKFVNFLLNDVIDITPKTIEAINAALHLSGLPDDRKAEYLVKAFSKRFERIIEQIMGRETNKEIIIQLKQEVETLIYKIRQLKELFPQIKP
jgi:hypothetical protein